MEDKPLTSNIRLKLGVSGLPRQCIINRVRCAFYRREGRRRRWLNRSGSWLGGSQRLLRRGGSKNWRSIRGWGRNERARSRSLRRLRDMGKRSHAGAGYMALQAEGVYGSQPPEELEEWVRSGVDRQDGAPGTRHRGRAKLESWVG